MANPEHLNELKKRPSKESWDEFRKKESCIDLSEVNFEQEGIEKKLEYFDFTKVNLEGADLTQANLEGANFTKANLKRAVLCGANLKGATLIEAHLEDANLASLDLSNANLEGADLTRADLKKAILCRANLQGSTLDATDLTELEATNFAGINLSRASLIETNVSGLNLNHANLEGTNLTRANLNEASLCVVNLKGAKLDAANLKEADLREAKELTGEQLSSTNLENAKIPSHIKKQLNEILDKTLNKVEETSNKLERIFIILLISCIYCWLTIASATHTQLIADSATSPLPIIGVKISITKFYLTMPYCLLIFYIYFHLNLQRLWEMIASLPVVFLDGTILDQRSQPRHMEGFIRARSYLLRRESTPGHFLYGYLFTFLTWLSVPCTLIGFWWSFLPRRDLTGDIVTLSLIVVITMATTFGLWSYHHATKALHTKKELGKTHLLKRIYYGLRNCAIFFMFIAFIILIRRFFFLEGNFNAFEMITLLVLGNLPMYFGMPLYRLLLENYSKKNQCRSWTRRIARTLSKHLKHLDIIIAVFGALLVLAGFAFILYHQKGISIWIKRSILIFTSVTMLGGLKIFQELFMSTWRKKMNQNNDKPNYSYLDFTRIIPVVAFSLSLIFLMKISLQRTCLPESWTFLNYLVCYPALNLDRQEISKKSLNWTATNDNNNTLVIGADLKKANLHYALANQSFLVKSDLSQTNLSEAHFQYADLRKVDFRQSNLTNATFTASRLNKAKFSIFNDCHIGCLKQAILRYVNFRQAELVGVDLKGADLFNATLAEADLTGSQLSGTNLIDADLSYANLEGANLGALVAENKIKKICSLKAKCLTEQNHTSEDKKKKEIKCNGNDFFLFHDEDKTTELCGAKLNKANLHGALMCKTKLVKSQLNNTTLSGANLQGANLREAELDKADLLYANLYGADLTDAKNLDEHQLSESCFDTTTKLPKQLRKQRPTSIMAKECATIWGKRSLKLEVGYKSGIGISSQNATTACQDTSIAANKAKQYRLKHPNKTQAATSAMPGTNAAIRPGH